MTSIRQVSLEAVQDLLLRAAPEKSQALAELLDRLRPTFLLNTEEERILFQADLAQRTITFGGKGIQRLQAHAYATGIGIAAIGTPGYLGMSCRERERLWAPADALLTWAVARDLQQWLKQAEGYERNLEEIMKGSAKDLPEDLLSTLTRRQIIFGEGAFRIASAFILFHELAHLHHRHIKCDDAASVRQEKEADRFAADWLLDAPSVAHTARLKRLFSVGAVLMWLTVRNAYLGPSHSRTHPEPYDRLFQVLDHAIADDEDEEPKMVWFLVFWMLFRHMENARIELKPECLPGTPREDVSYLINLLSRRNS